MQALGIFAYLLVCLAVAGVLTLVYSLFRDIQKSDSFRSWRVMSLLSVIIAFLPYGYVEANTRLHGEGMDKAIEKALKSAKVEGHLSYYKVKSARGNTAEVIVVAKEKTTLNKAESCVLLMELQQDPKKGWTVNNYTFVDSFKRGKDSFTVPIYW